MGTTESFIDSMPATASSAAIEDLLNVGAAQDDDPDWMPEEELLQPSTSRARPPSCARKPAIRSVQKVHEEEARSSREGGAVQYPTHPNQEREDGNVIGGAAGTEVQEDARAEQPGEQGLPRQEEEQAAGDGGGAGRGAGEEPEAQAAAREHGGEVRQAEKADEPLPDSLKVPQN